MGEYNWTEVSIPIEFTDDYEGAMKISRMIWSWQRKRFEGYGWTADGGIWPRLRVTRPMRLEDYIYSRPSPLQKLMDERLHSDGSYGGIDRGSVPFWRTLDPKSKQR